MEPVKPEFARGTESLLFKNYDELVKQIKFAFPELLGVKDETIKERLQRIAISLSEDLGSPGGPDNRTMP